MCFEITFKFPCFDLVIGDEILKGQVRDTNSHFIISRLYNIGVRVLKVIVIYFFINFVSLFQS